MSYSRFSNSEWYTYWDCCTDGMAKGLQLLTVHKCGSDKCWSWDYDTLQQDESILTKEILNVWPEASKENIEELLRIFVEFVDDVNQDPEFGG